MRLEADRALPRARRPQARDRSHSRWLVFSEPGAPLVTVCGLHGGAGTTTVACMLAEHAAAVSPAGHVLAVEADGRAAELAGRLRAASELSLNALAGAGSTGAPIAQRADGLRVLAAAAPHTAEPPAGALAAVLAQARAAHALCVIDAGCVRQPPAEPALAGADVVVWVSEPARLAADAFGSPLIRPTRGARWVLALVPRTRARRGRLPRSLRDELDAVVVMPPSDEPHSHEAAERLARAVRG